MGGLVLALVLGSASAFIPNSPAAKRAAARVQASDPWFPDAVATVVPNTVTAATSEYSESFLEASPYTDQSNIPVNTYKAKSPYVGKIVSTKRIVGPKATGETCDIIIDHGGNAPYWEGQSFGVIPPGTNPKNGKPNSVRLYSIAASRYGDNMEGKQTTLCVRRATYWCPELGAEDPAKKGVCSNYLCDASPGDEVKMTGPSGKVMLLPEDKPEADIITVATGTGIAPYRAFWKRLFVGTRRRARIIRAPSGSSSVWQTQMLSCTTRNSRSLLQTTITSSLITHSRASRLIRRVAKCTFRTRLRSTLMTFSTASTTERTSTSVVLKA